MGAAFLSGITAAMFLVAGTFFFKFWRASRNRFFILFASAFLLFSIERAVSLGVYVNLSPDINQKFEVRGWVYLIRLLGFALIFVAIFDRNKTKIAQRKDAERDSTRPA